MIVITHRPALAAACDRVMLLRGGMIEAFAPSREVLRQAGAKSGGAGTVVTGSFAPTMRPQAIRFGS
ncbi:hypothetical protein [Mesorhizobium sp. CU2]|nr:hypothetical protein [Mesorhizobium sp. CU2]